MNWHCITVVAKMPQPPCSRHTRSKRVTEGLAPAPNTHRSYAWLPSIPIPGKSSQTSSARTPQVGCEASERKRRSRTPTSKTPSAANERATGAPSSGETASQRTREPHVPVNVGRGLRLNA
jgi:hypothetical protein